MTRPASQLQALVTRRQHEGHRTRRAALSGKKTSLVVPAATVRELRALALQHDCLMNDLIQIALADLLSAAGRAPHLSVDENLRQAVKNSGG